MKKYLSILLLCSILMFLTGCGKEKLICTKKEEVTKDMWVTQEVKMFFQKDKIQNLQLERKIKVEGEFTKSIHSLEKTLKEEFTNFHDKAVRTTSKIEDNQLTMKIKVNYKKMREETKKAFGTVPYDKNKKEMKTYFENQRFVCK